ncbi:sugar transferase [Candidatus Fermentibacteria bacterium]|nr:sugar transferase [Candidatus Fermentibacteria bacterium]
MGDGVPRDALQDPLSRAQDERVGAVTVPQGSRRERRFRAFVVPSLLMLHAVTVMTAMVSSYWLRFHVAPALGLLAHIHPPGIGLYLPGFVGGAAIVVAVLSYLGCYGSRRRLVRDGDYTMALKACTIGTVLQLALSYFTKSTYFSRLIFLMSWVNGAVLFYLVLMILARVQRLLVRRGLARSRFLIVGDGESARALRRRLQVDADLGKEFVGFISSHSLNQPRIHAPEVVGSVDDVGAAIGQFNVDHVYITSRDLSHAAILRILDDCSTHHAQVDMLSDLYEILHGGATVQQVAGFPMVSLRQVALRQRQETIKRWMDVMVALALMVFAVPLACVIAAAIRLDSPGPVFYSQVRIGKGGRRFRMYKFRSMALDADERLDQVKRLNEAAGPLFKIREDPRVTRIGRLLRRTSLDELPQIFNVLNGDMSLVGPRPPLPSEVESYADWHHRRLTVRQGMTGLWQVSGRSLLAFDEMVNLDIYYIENWSIWLDLLILLRTIPIVLQARGAY